MPYCFNCKAEYNGSEKTCPKCGSKLVGSPEEAFLISVRDGYEAGMVEGSLRTAGIPFVRKGHGGPAGFSRYDTKYKSLGADFFVPPELLKKAKDSLPPVEGAADIQSAMPDDSAQDKSADAEVPEEKAPDEPPKSPFKSLLSIILFLIVAAIVIFGVDAVMNYLRTFMGYK